MIFLKYKYVDYFEEYSRIMQFNKNKKEPIHRWYSFVEGYSKEFITSIINEMNDDNIVCLDPFSGSGTTALEMQNMNIKCYSFEVNPLMYKIANVKMETSYEHKKIEYYLKKIKAYRKEIEVDIEYNFKTLIESEKTKKWNYDKDVYIAIKKLYDSILKIRSTIYRNLFVVALASILLDVSNLYRNGKCLSYKKNWNEIVICENDVFKKFDEKIQNEIIVDVKFNTYLNEVCNKDYLFWKDCRIGIDEKIKDDSINLVITSPPYLNSRDYTDTYMLELKTLFYKEHEQITNLRKNTIRSHVQIKWTDASTINNELLNSTLKKLEEAKVDCKQWNSSILDMVRLYFVDMDIIFKAIYKKMKKDGMIYFNVSNSAYYNVLINTIEICSSIAEANGFNVVEIRKARYIHSSPQQKESINNLLEAVIVIKK